MNKGTATLRDSVIFAVLDLIRHYEKIIERGEELAGGPLDVPRKVQGLDHWDARRAEAGEEESPAEQAVRTARENQFVIPARRCTRSD